MSASSMPIGALGKETNVKVPTIRFYESVGLMPEPSRTGAGRRIYDKDALQRLTFIRHSRDLGFSVTAVRSLLDLADDPNRSCAEADRIASEHLANVEEKIGQLELLRAELVRVISECAHGRVAECRVIEVLSDHALCLTPEHRM